MQSNRHNKLCQCHECVTQRFARFVESVEGFYKEFHVRPKSPEQTVKVKQYTVAAHFRRNNRHMSNDPALRAKAEAYLARMARKK